MEFFPPCNAEMGLSYSYKLQIPRDRIPSVVMMYKMHNLAPSYLQTDLINPSEIHYHFTRQTTSNKLSIPKFQTDCYKYSVIVSSIRAWNGLDSLIRETSSLNSYKILLKRSCGTY